MSPGPLPQDAVLLHIGPYKTGTTALQSALFARRDELAAYGVAYPGNWRRLYAPGHAVLRWAPRGREVPPIQRWDRFAARVRELSGVRVAVSTEDFGRIQNLKRSGKIVRDLGADRVHVLAVARAYHRLLPSHWQERVKSLDVTGYDAFLHKVVDADNPDRAFLSSHDVSHMTSMWLPFLPPERFTLVITDDSDRTVLQRTVERLLGLPRDFLSLPVDSVDANVSLSHEATELLRRVNELFRERGWPDEAYRRYLRDGLTAAMQSAGRSPLETAVPTIPAWAVDRVRRMSEERIAAIERSGVNVIGDVTALLPPEDVGSLPNDSAPRSVSVDSAAAAVSGVVEALLRRERSLEVDDGGTATGRSDGRPAPRRGRPERD